MEPATTAALIAGGAQLGGSLLSAASGIFGSKKSSKAAAKIAAMQLAWEREKAQNSIQWSVQDALKAGINPAVAVNTNSNAGSINPPMPDTSGYSKAGEMLGQGLANTAQTLQRQKEIEIAEGVGESTENKNNAEAQEALERTKNIPEYLKVEQENALTAQARQRAEEKHLEVQNQLIKEQTAYQNMENALKNIETEVNKGNFGKAMAYIDRLTETIKGVGGAVNSFVPTIALWKGATTGKELISQIKQFKNSNAFKLMQKTYSK